MTRRDALVLNRLAQALAEDPKLALRAQNRAGGAAPLRYHGVTFAEVDDWARAAVRLALRPCFASEALCPAPEALCSEPEAPASGRPAK